MDVIDGCIHSVNLESIESTLERLIFVDVEKQKRKLRRERRRALDERMIE